MEMLSNIKMESAAAEKLFSDDGILSSDTLTVKDAAKLMNKTEQFVRIGLQRGILPFGWAVNMGKQWSYFISKSKFEQATGIKVPAEF